MNHNEVKDAWYEEKICANCGKRFTVIRPSEWAYKRIRTGKPGKYFCTWKCLRAWENGTTEKERKDMAGKTEPKPRRDRREVLESLLEAFEGGCVPPVEYMRRQGYAKPDNEWYRLRDWSKEHAPDLYQRLKDHLLVKKQAATVETSDKLPEKAQTVELVYDPSIKEEYERDLAKRKETAEREERGRRIAEALDKADRARMEMIDGIEPLQPASLWSRVLDDGTFTKVTGMGMMLRGASYQIILTAYQWFKLTEEILVALGQLDVTNPGEEGDRA